MRKLYIFGDKTVELSTPQGNYTETVPADQKFKLREAIDLYPSNWRHTSKADYIEQAMASMIENS